MLDFTKSIVLETGLVMTYLPHLVSKKILFNKFFYSFYSAFFGPSYLIEYEFDFVRTSTPLVNIKIKNIIKKTTKIFAGL